MVEKIHSARNTTADKTFVFEQDIKIDKEPEEPSMLIRENHNNYQEKYKENDQYQVTYHYTQALHGFIINIGHLLLGPCILPIFYWIYGKNLMKSMVFTCTPLYFLGDFGSWLWMFSTAIMLFMHPELNEQLSVMYIGTGSVIILRQILVSIKYGYYPKKTWELYCNSLVTQEVILSNLILVVWVQVPAIIAEPEMISSIKRLKVPLTSLNLKFLRFPNICSKELSNEIISCDTRDRISILKVATYLIKKVTETQRSYELKLIEMCGYIYIGIYFALRYYSYGVSGFRYDPLEIVYTLMSLFKSYASSTQFVKFIAAGLYDYKRKRMLMAQCSGMISKVDRKHLLFNKTERPLIDISDPMSLLSWYYMRRAFLDFGKRYTRRIFLYASLILPVCITIIVLLFLQILGLVPYTYNYYLVPGIFLSIEVFVLLIHMSFSALELNKYYSIHKDILLEKSGQLRNDEDKQELLGYIDHVAKRLEHDEIIRPITIMGITIDNAFMIQLGALAISAVYAIINLLTKKN